MLSGVKSYHMDGLKLSYAQRIDTQCFLRVIETGLKDIVCGA